MRALVLPYRLINICDLNVRYTWSLQVLPHVCPDTKGQGFGTKSVALWLPLIWRWGIYNLAYLRCCSKNIYTSLLRGKLCASKREIYLFRPQEAPLLFPHNWPSCFAVPINNIDLTSSIFFSICLSFLLFRLLCRAQTDSVYPAEQKTKKTNRRRKRNNFLSR